MTTTDNREAELRAALVTIASASALQQRPRRKPTALIGIAAFALAGALTGGALSTIAYAQSVSQFDDSRSELTAQITAMELVGTHSPLVGDPFVVTTSGRLTIDLGVAPDGANGVVFGIHCNDRGAFLASLDAKPVGTVLTCEDEADTQPGHGRGGMLLHPTGDGPHQFVIEGPAGASFSVWASWAQQPEAPVRSAEQSAELADGTVTADEYRNAFHRFVACMAEAGYPVQFTDESTTVFRYGTSGEAYSAGVDKVCYESEFRDVDIAWQQANPMP